MRRMIRYFLCISFFLVVTYSLFGMLYRPQRQRAKRPAITFHVVPMDNDSMYTLGFCPLYNKQEFAFDPELLHTLQTELRVQGVVEEDIKAQLATLLPAEGLKYHVFNRYDMRFEEKIAPADSPCTIPLGMHGRWDRYLIQYKSLDQFELAKKTGLSPALCAGHALNNARFMYNYVTTGQIKYLRNIQNLELSANFLLDTDISDWVTVDVVKNNIKKLIGIKASQISAVSSAQLFDSQLQDKSVWALVNHDEYQYVQSLKNMIQRGLKNNEQYLHIIILGNEEFVLEHGHYFAFAIVKVGTTIQYVVLDTMPNVYHLQPGSHERDRLMFIIQNIEQGASDISLVNIQEEQLKAAGVF